ncbi:hypothetical protein [Paenibacillus shenyangensis]|uniref:hypothetical protein n=1 Tax=Paenibacillus sp. A9 TaxID=1284352 RepID=UPI000382CAC6|nr:hypothetical protein [Paenibacillus sp. A9]
MPGYKYTLIVSQLYFSRHFFIVHHNDEFLETARNFTEEVVLYKRGVRPEWNDVKITHGDLALEYCMNGIRSRYNVNDVGDIYFIQANTTDVCIDSIMYYHEESIRGMRGYQSKKVLENIENYHEYHRLKEIVEKHFSIV